MISMLLEIPKVMKRHIAVNIFLMFIAIYISVVDDTKLKYISEYLSGFEIIYKLYDYQIVMTLFSLLIFALLFGLLLKIIFEIMFQFFLAKTVERRVTSVIKSIERCREIESYSEQAYREILDFKDWLEIQKIKALNSNFKVRLHIITEKQRLVGEGLENINRTRKENINSAIEYVDGCFDSEFIDDNKNFSYGFGDINMEIMYVMGMLCISSLQYYQKVYEIESDAQKLSMLITLFFIWYISEYFYLLLKQNRTRIINRKNQIPLRLLEVIDKQKRI